VFTGGIAGAQSYETLFASFETGGWPTFSSSDLSGPDHNWNGVPDPFELGLLATAMAEDPAVQAAYDANLAIAQQYIASAQGVEWGLTAADAVQVACYATFDPSYGAIDWYFWVPEPFRSQFTPVASLAADADFDGDGIANLTEYNTALTTSFANPVGFGQMACRYWGPFYPGNQALPVAGLAALGVLGGIVAAGGALKLRRKS